MFRMRNKRNINVVVITTRTVNRGSTPRAGITPEGNNKRGKTMKNAKNQNREIYVFVGQNASTGTPHPVTGHYSFYGRIYRINGTLKQAREWVEYKDHYNTQGICVVGGRRRMRGFCLGQYIRDFEDTLKHAFEVHAQEDEYACDWYVG